MPWMCTCATLAQAAMHTLIHSTHSDTAPCSVCFCCGLVGSWRAHPTLPQPTPPHPTRFYLAPAARPQRFTTTSPICVRDACVVTVLDCCGVQFMSRIVTGTGRYLYVVFTSGPGPSGAYFFTLLPSRTSLFSSRAPSLAQPLPLTQNCTPHKVVCACQSLTWMLTCRICGQGPSQVVEPVVGQGVEVGAWTALAVALAPAAYPRRSRMRGGSSVACSGPTLD